MNLANKSYRDNRTGEVIKVIDSFENIAILENKTKIDTRRLLDPTQYTEYIDPNVFIESASSNAYSSIFESIKSIPTDRLPIDGEINVTTTGNDVYTSVGNDSAIITSDPEDEKAELARKYGIIDNTSATNKQNEAFAKLLGDDTEDLPRQQEPVQRVEINRDEKGEVTGSVIVNNTESIPYQKQYSEQVEDPVHTMFKGIKRSVEFYLDLKLENKIPKLEFIEMMEESYDKSIIGFLANDITQEILNNPEYLRASIEAKIRDMVYGSVKKTATKTTTKRTPRPNTTNRKPTPKKKTEIKEDLSTKPISKRSRKKETEEQ